VAEEQRPLLNEWRSLTIKPKTWRMRERLRAAVNGLNVIRSLPAFARHRRPGSRSRSRRCDGMAKTASISSARPQAAAPSAARDTPAAIEALELAHAYVDEVREADTPALEDHELRNHHLDLLALASKQFDAAQKRDPNAVLEGQDKSGIAYRFSIDELRADALLLEGITHHTYDLKRTIPALREATTLNPNRAYAFYVLGLTYAANMDKSGAVAALRRAVALNPQNLSYRKELNRAQSLSAREIATHKATRFGKWILDSSTMAWNSFAASWNIVRVPRLLFQAIYRGVFRL
jgi:tetratricopeptide (TPR) repeat protein